MSYFGTTSERLGLFLARHIGTIKMLTALVFVGLALWMVWTLVPLFGGDAPWRWGLMGGALLVIGVGAALLQLGEKPTEPKKPQPPERPKQPAKRKKAKRRGKRKKRY